MRCGHAIPACIARTHLSSGGSTRFCYLGGNVFDDVERNQSVPPLAHVLPLRIHEEGLRRRKERLRCGPLDIRHWRPRHAVARGPEVDVRLHVADNLVSLASHVAAAREPNARVHRSRRVFRAAHSAWAASSVTLLLLLARSERHFTERVIGVVPSLREIQRRVSSIAPYHTPPPSLTGAERVRTVIAPHARAGHPACFVARVQFIPS